MKVDDDRLEELVHNAPGGDAAALEQVVRAVQDEVFDLAFRVLARGDSSGN
jgi:hypothetical protein